MTAPVPPDPESIEVARAHAARLATLDPLLPAQALPPITEGRRLLRAGVGAGRAVGVTRVGAVAEDEEGALWSALRWHGLTVRFAGPIGDRVAAFDALLDAWEPELAAHAVAGDRDASAIVTWPSRDDTPVRPLVHHGFAPLLVAAARQHRGPTTVPAAPPGVLVRRAHPGELDEVTDLVHALQRHDAAYGTVTERAAARDLLRASVSANLTDWTWVAEYEGQLVGVVQAQPPERAQWAAGSCSTGPVGYLGYLYVRPELRSGGVGHVLAATCHAALDDVGTGVTMLHHALANPLSTPFWATQGYRPLWTTWQRRPAVR